VIYVLDGEWNTGIALQMAQYLANEGFMPPNIIVSIPNFYVKQANMRDRDFTPTKYSEVPG
jgi:predicted alpha/beta superfamily hydrolase